MVGFIVFLGFASLSLVKFNHTSNYFFLLLFAKHILLTINFKFRSKPIFKSNTKVKLLSYFSAILPLFYKVTDEVDPQIKLVCNFFLIIGTVLSTFGILELGKNFGVSPAKRTLVNTGVYKLFRHPIYIGYAISEFSLIIFSPITNLTLFITSISLYCIRSKKEDEILKKC